nr:MAG TPA: ParB protein [Caudoviricetes sp.]
MAKAGGETRPQEMKVGDGLFVRVIQGSALKEQDINAQQMDPTKFERLVENIRLRGSLESLPYCHQPNGEGPISIVSGHHRAKAARVAGLSEFAVLVDTREMPRSLLRAKQIAHNELTGEPDADILRKMIEEIDSVEDLLISGLDEDYLGELEPATTALELPSAMFDWRMVSLMFLPEQMKRFEGLIEALGSQNELVGVAQAEQFEKFSRALVEFGQVRNIKNVAAIVDTLTKIALAEIDKHRKAAEDEAAEDA